MFLRDWLSKVFVTMPIILHVLSYQTFDPYILSLAFPYPLGTPTVIISSLFLFTYSSLTNIQASLL